MPVARRYLLILAGVVACLLGVATVHAQAPSRTRHAWQRNFYFQRLDSRNGLDQASVSLIFQDRRGYMWVATGGGLYRYDGYSLKRFEHDPNRTHSLPGDLRVTALANASGGRLWLGSSNAGLLLLDPRSGDVLPLPKAVRRGDVPITDLLGLPDGNVLVGSTRGIDKLVSIPKPRLDAVWREPKRASVRVRSMSRCPDGRVYAAAGPNIVAVTHASTARILAKTQEPIRALYCTAKGKLLLGNATGLASVNPSTGTRTRLWHADHGALVGVDAIVADGAGRLWLALSDRTLLRIGPNGSRTRVRPAPAGIRGGLPDARISTLFVDRTGLLWVGTWTQGAAWTPSAGSPVRAVLNLAGDPRRRVYVRAFLPAGDGRFWIALSGLGLIRYDPATRAITSFRAALAQLVDRADPSTAAASPPATPGATLLWTAARHNAPHSIQVFGIVPGSHGTLLLPTNHGIVRFDPSSGKASYLTLDGTAATTPTRVLFRARSGDLWTAPFHAGLVHYHAHRRVQRFDRSHGLGSNTVLTIAEDHAGHIWVGTTNGVSMIDPDSGKVRTFREVPGRKDSLAGRTVASILVTRHDGVWIGSLSGISHLEDIDAKGAHFKRYGLGDGLPDDTIDCMLADHAGNIWFSTNLGLARLDPKTGRIRSFGPTDGLQGNEYNPGACLRTAGDRLLFGGHGFDIINPASIHPTEHPAPVVFTGVYTGSGQAMDPASAKVPVRLPADARRLEVTFAALDYSASRRNRYRHRLLGRHRQWSAPSRSHTIAYTDLAAGDYKLEIQSMLRDGAPGPTTSLTIHVDSPWWWRPTMRIIYAVAVALLIAITLLGWRGHHLEGVRHRRQLRLRESRLRHALWGSGDEFWDMDLEQGTILRLGPEGAPGGHHERSLPVEQWRQTMVHPDDLPNVDHALAEHLAGHSEHFEVEHRVRGSGGEWVWVISRGRVVEHNTDGKPLRVCGTERDIRVLRAADRDRRIASEVIRNMSEAVAVTDLDFRFVSVNAAFTRMTGYTEREALGCDASILNGNRHAPDSHRHVRQTLAETGHWRGELWERRKDGEEFLCWVELNEVCDASGQRSHMIGVLTDITDRKRAEQELRYLANYDTLTGLPNRALLGERLGAAVIGARRSGHRVGVLFLDLDRFKHVNDSLGHSVGDRTLKAAGARLRQCVRENDVVARLGGDEFTVVLEDLADARGAEDMAQRLLQAFGKPLNPTSAQETVISPSIGIALYPDHGQTPADLLKCADTAMYYAKERGRNTWAVYDPGMDMHARDHAILINALGRALDRNELRLVYQPKMALHTGVITGVEALLRWHNPELGEIPPHTFIPLAEETGQIHELSAYVFATACADLARWRKSGHRYLTMAINLSAAQLNRPDLTVHICDMLAEHDVAPDRIELELTESMVMANAEQSVRLLGELKKIGTRLAIDDFGTGYSSLAYLKRLPIDTLKIDQAFVGDVTSDPDDAAITSTIITMAHSLQLKVVAEGVETPAQLAFLRTERCDEIQGFWLSRPLSAEDCLEFLDRDVATGAGAA